MYQISCVTLIVWQCSPYKIIHVFKGAGTLSNCLKITSKLSYIAYYSASMQAPHTQIYANQVKVVTCMHPHSPAHHVARGRKILQMHGFPKQMYGETS